MLLRILIAIFCSLRISGTVGRSISVVVKHRHTFAVDDIRETPYIQLPEEVEAKLRFEPRSRNNHALNKVTNQRIEITSKDNKDDHTETETASSDTDHTDDENITQDTGNSMVNVDYHVNEFADNDESVDGDIDNDYDNLEDDENVIGSSDEQDRNTLTDDNYTDEFSNALGSPFDSIPKTDRRSKGDQTDANNLHDITEEEAEIKDLYELTERKRRAVENDWYKSRKPRNVGHEEELPDSDIWEDVTDEELEAVQRQQYIFLAKYIGWTLLSVSFFVLVGICFLRDPITCIFSFGSGCPCFLIICPCVRGFVNKYLNVKKMVQDAMNKYTPGVIVNDDGTIQHYEPTAEEVAYLKDLLDEITGQTLI